MQNNPKIMEIAVRRTRLYIRDTKELNKLLGGKYESDDQSVRQAIMDALWDWNISNPPIASVLLQTHPAPHLLIRKAAIELLKSAGIWHSREHLPSQDGGTSADDHAKIGEYSQWLQYLDADYERKKTDLKVSINIQDSYGGVGSEYDYDSGWGIFNSDLPITAPAPEEDTIADVPSIGGIGGDGGNPQDPVQQFIIPFSYSDPSSRPILIVAGGNLIFEIRVLVTTPLNGSAPTLSIGDVSDTAAFLGTGAANLKVAGNYITNLDANVSAQTLVFAYLTSDGSTQGSGSIVISYGVPT
jgi:hypothetical protein